VQWARENAERSELSDAPGRGSGRILLVDDEDAVREVIAAMLESYGYDVEAFAEGAAALAHYEHHWADTDLVVLDMMLPGANGLDILRRIRQLGDMAVIMLTARAEEPDRVAGLELGADDYVVKPFSPRELAARVNGVLRRANSKPTAAADRLEFGELVIDQKSREVVLDGETLEFTPKEFDVLAHLAASPREVFSRADLLRADAPPRERRCDELARRRVARDRARAAARRAVRRERSGRVRQADPRRLGALGRVARARRAGGPRVRARREPR